MGLIKKWDIERTWGSHQPVLKAVLEVLKPNSAIECGCGDYSTPFLQKVPKLITIEHDSRWAEKMRVQYPLSTHRWLIKTFNAKNPTRIDELPAGEFKKICDYYENLEKDFDAFDLLFVDTFTVCRVPAVFSLGGISEYIIIHDLEPPGPEVYQWEMLDDFFKGWNKWIHKPIGHVAKIHQIPWTGLYSRTELPIKEINEAMFDECTRLWKLYMPLVKEKE